MTTELIINIALAGVGLIGSVFLAMAKFSLNRLLRSVDKLEAQVDSLGKGCLADHDEVVRLRVKADRMEKDLDAAFNKIREVKS